MLKVGHAVAVGIIGAGIIHVLVVLMLPAVTARQTWDRLSLALDPYFVTRVDPDNGVPIYVSDPFFATRVCRFNLRDGPLRVRTTGRSPPWFASIYAPDSKNLSSFNDRMVPNGALNAFIFMPEQMDVVKHAAEHGPDRPFLVEVGNDAALLAVSAFVPDPSWRQIADDFLSNSTCVSEIRAPPPPLNGVELRLGRPPS